MRVSRRTSLALLLTPLVAAGLARLGRPDPPVTGTRGTVVDGAGPVAGAVVRLQATDLAVRTDAAGRFRLPPHPHAGRVTASKDGYLIAGQRRPADLLTLRLRPLPAEDFEGYEWVDPAPDRAGEHHCGNCHGEIYREWSASGHARAATGRHFLNLYAGTAWDGRAGVGWGLLREHPDGAGVCAACHAPTVADSDPALYDLRKVRGVAAAGVHCDYCHKVAGTSAAEPGLTFGRFDLLLRRPKEGQLFFGPLDDVDRGEDAYSPLYKDSRYCASCHEGTVFGVHVYSTYSEWLQSPARREGRHCQHCHMAPTGRMTNVAPGRGGRPRSPLTLGNHTFFQPSQEAMLRACLKLSADLRREGGGVRARVRLVAEKVGHRVPTGFVDRHLILVVEGLDARGKTLPPRRGPTLPAPAGSGLAGRPGRLYAKFLRDFDGLGPVPFWRADPEAHDTRLTPGRPDEAVFEFPPELARLRVRIVHRRFWAETAREKGWPDADLVVHDATFVAGR